ncbi:MAG: PKD domain-containing protein [Chloroflexi bacterium]|nr:PKD domain-containing protein [Chloroflexota bacterium]
MIAGRKVLIGAAVTLFFLASMVRAVAQTSPVSYSTASLSSQPAGLTTGNPAACLPFDFDGNRLVDAADISAVAARWRLSQANPDPDGDPFTPNFATIFDIDQDGTIRINDIQSLDICDNVLIIPQGTDHFATPPGSTFIDVQLPPGFFGTKNTAPSDPFTGRIYLDGQPIVPLPSPEGAQSFQPTGAFTPLSNGAGQGRLDVRQGTSDPDTIIRRLADAQLPGPGPTPPTMTIPIEIVALSLRSVQPISITYGSQPPSFFDIFVTLDNSHQISGTLTLTRTGTVTGTFSSILPVNSQITFTNTAGPSGKDQHNEPLQRPFIFFNGFGTGSPLGPAFDTGVPTPWSVPDFGVPFDPQVRIVFPQNGTTWDGAVGLAANEVNGVYLASLSQAIFEYTRDGVNFSPIARIAPDERYMETTWNTTGLTAGPYTVTIRLQDIWGHETSDAVSIAVNSQPQAQASTQCSGPPDSVLFNGLESFDPDLGDSIVSYTWDFGDGSPRQTGPVVTHQYAEPGTYYPQLAVIDTHGAIGMVHFGVDSSTCNVALKGCDPKQMTVLTNTLSSWPMYWVIGDAYSRTLGTRSTISATTWKTDPVTTSYQIINNFEVMVELEPNSDASKCTEGQSVQRTATYGGHVFKVKKKEAGANPHDPSPGNVAEAGYNNPDGKYDDDGYHNDKAHTIDDITKALKGWTKVHVDQNKISWLDGPGNDDVLKRDIIAAGGFSYKAKFKASVKGDTKTVTCSWEVEITATGDADTFTVDGKGLFNLVCNP